MGVIQLLTDFELPCESRKKHYTFEGLKSNLGKCYLKSPRLLKTETHGNLFSSFTAHSFLQTIDHQIFLLMGFLSPIAVHSLSGHSQAGMQFGWEVLPGTVTPLSCRTFYCCPWPSWPSHRAAKKKLSS